MEFEVVENNDKAFCTVKRNKIDGVKIAEIYWTEGNNTDLDFVILFFNYKKKQITELVEEYHEKKAGCIIGCNDLDGKVIDYAENDEYEAFSSLMKQFDLHLDSATSVDFENLVEFCSSTETGCPTISISDFKSTPGTEIYIVTEESSSISELKSQVSESCRKIFSPREQKISKVMIAFLTNGYEMSLDEVKEIFDSLDGFITGECCMMLSDNEVTRIDNKAIKVSLIFCEE